MITAQGARAAAKLLRQPRTARALHASATRSAFSKFTMPAMSPTMTEGGIATWKVEEGKSFSAGDVLLEIETDKATMDVEAQDDGVMAKILIQAGEKNVQVGKILAILAEEGDDLSKAEQEVPSESESTKSESSSSSSSSSPAPAKPSQPESSSSSAPQPSSKAPDRHSASISQPTGDHSTKPIFPTVMRLLAENNISIEEAEQKIKGTGKKGMITQGDVLVHLGKVSSPTGSFKDEHLGVSAFGDAVVKKAGGQESGTGQIGSASKSSSTSPQSLTATELRAAILRGLHESRFSRSVAASAAPPPPSADSIAEALADYSITPSKAINTPGKVKKDWLDGLL